MKENNTNMNKEFVTYEQASALKELGFDEPCLAGYQLQTATLFSDIPHTLNGNIHRNSEGSFTCAPTYQQAFRWFREKGYYSEINVGCTQIDGAIGFSWRIWKPWIIEEWSPERQGEEWSYETYEEAESACLDKLIEITKNK